MTDRLLTVQDVSDYLGVPVATIYSWWSSSTYGPPGRRVGKRLCYLPEDVKTWFTEQSTEVA